MDNAEGDTLYMWVVYDQPHDFPNHFVAWRFQATRYEIDGAALAAYYPLTIGLIV
jgi:hypothetical protein